MIDIPVMFSGIKRGCVIMSLIVKSSVSVSLQKKSLIVMMPIILLIDSSQTGYFENA
jgi:hypothetical protein